MDSKLTYNDILSSYDEYPAPMRPYLVRAETHPDIRNKLTKSFMRVFIDILSRAPIADPLRPLKMRMDVVAEDLGISKKTVSRAVDLMREQGWVSYSSGFDGRNDHGRFCSSEFILSTELRQMLGLPTEVKKTVDNLAESEDKSGENTTLSPGLYSSNKIFLKEASFKEGPFLKKQEANPMITSPLQEDFPKKPNLPADLLDIVATLNISTTGICALMALAKKAKQRLQDIWNAKRDQIIRSGAKEGRAFRYLSFLIGTGEDFSFIGRSAVKDKFKPGITSMWNKKYSGDNGVLVRIHGDGSGEVSDLTRKSSYISPRDMEHVYEAISSRKLRVIIE